MRFILMYHRVCPKTPENAPWFVRGMAVQPEVWHAQIQWLSPRVRFVTLRELCSPNAPQSKHLCAITFDDGFRDVLPLSNTGVPFTLFPVAGALGDGETLLPADAYYGLLQSAQVRAPTFKMLKEAGFVLPENEQIPSIDEDWRWWVRGPIKQQIIDTEPHQWSLMLGSLASVLDGQFSRASSLYLTRNELSLLHQRGHEIGGHGATHRALDNIPEPFLVEELRASRSLLDSIGVAEERSFCFPSGRFDDQALAVLPKEGFVRACTVIEGVVTTETQPLQMPRLFMRNAMPLESGWPQVLL